VKNIQTVITKIESWYKDIPLFSISLNERERFSEIIKKETTYGEINLNEIFNTLSKLKLNKDMTFIDCGSGAGKIVFLAHYTHFFKTCIGIEYIKPLIKISKKILSEKKISNIFFENKNFLTFNFKKTACVYMNNICFSENTCNQLSERLNQLKKNSLVISNKKIPLSKKFIHINTFQDIKASWGKTTFFIYEKKETTSHT
jgi:hypothetical protein